jgi:hypothetical protein
LGGRLTQCSRQLFHPVDVFRGSMRKTIARREERRTPHFMYLRTEINGTSAMMKERSEKECHSVEMVMLVKVVEMTMPGSSYRLSATEEILTCGSRIASKPTR